MASALVLLAPIRSATHEYLVRYTGKISWMRFWLHDATLPKSQVVLSYADGIHAYDYIIPVKDFYEGRPK
jgi:hypothetical protein